MNFTVSFSVPNIYGDVNPAVVASGFLGLAAGVVFVQGKSGASGLVDGALWFSRQVYMGYKQMNFHVAGLLGSLVLSALVAAIGQRVHGPSATLHPSVKGVALTVVACGLSSELWLLLSLAQAIWARRARLGLRDEQLLSMREFPSPSLIGAASFMSVIYVCLLVFYGIMFSGQVMCYHQDPVLLRPVATMRYLEWSFTVPVLMWTIGRVLLKQDLEAVLIPIFQTLSYIWLAWAGQVVEQHWLRALLISCCFTIYAESALRQIKWASWDKLFESALVIYQIVMFFFYGILYLVVLADMTDAFTEDILYTSMDLSVKIGHTVVFSAMQRSSDLDLFFRSVRNYLDILVGMRALVGAQFDFVINCKVTPFGLMIVSNSAMLDSGIGRQLFNQPLEDICFGKADRDLLRNHGLGRLPSRISKVGTASSPWERQEALTQVADILRIDIAWVESPMGSAPAEIFVAAAGENQDGDIVLIGLKLLYMDLVEDPDLPGQPMAEVADTISEFSEFHQGPMLQSIEANASSSFASIQQADLPSDPATSFDRDASAFQGSRRNSLTSSGEELKQQPADVTSMPYQESCSHAANSQQPRPGSSNDDAKAQVLARMTEIENQRDQAAKVLAHVNQLQEQKDEAAKALARITEQQRQEENAAKVMSRIADLELQKEEVSKDLARIADGANQSLADQVTAPSARSPKLTPILVEQNAALEAKKPSKSATLGVTRQVFRVPSSRHSARSFDGRSVCSLSPVEEEMTGESRTSEGSCSQRGASQFSQFSQPQNTEEVSSSVRNARPSNINCTRSMELAPVPSPASSANVSTWNNASTPQGDDDDRSLRSSVLGAEMRRHVSASEFDRGSMRGSVRGSVRGSEGGHSHATMKTYRTTLGESRNVQSTVHFLGNGGKMQALNFTVASSCPKYQEHVETDHNTHDWGKLCVKHDALKRECLLGHGSFAIVHKVSYGEEFYALKEFHNQAWTVRRRGFPYAVRREVSILARLASLGHPHVCRLTGIVMEPAIALMFELCEGGTYYACIYDSHQPFSWRQRHISLRQVIEALGHLHENQVVHRDLKSNNVLFLLPVKPESEPHVKVTDVGLARWVTSAQTESAEDELNISPVPPRDTQGHMTPLPPADWHAPELETGFYGTSVDVYAFGVLLLEVVTWSADLPSKWRRRIEILQESEKNLTIVSLLGSCLSSQAARPAVPQLLQSFVGLTESDGESFCDAWSGMPTETEPDKYLHG